MIKSEDLDDLLIRALPEFESSVRRHRADWPDEPMIYLLIGALFDFAVSSARDEWCVPDGAPLLSRIYDVVERALSEGDASVHDCFAIEMIEPIARDEDHQNYPNLECFMGSLALEEVRLMRQWRTRYTQLMAVVSDVSRATLPHSTGQL
jgi:hypothetical protein